MQWRILWVVLAMAFLGGCARYEFDIARPGGPPLAVNHREETRFQEGPLVYHALAKEDRLVLMVQNTLASAVELVGEKSSVVDPQGQSHPLRSQTIAPGAYIKLILPPLRPRFEQEPGGHFSIGVQAAAPVKREPIYLDYYSDVDATYWDWDGPSSVRLLLSYRGADGRTWSDELNLRKRKA